MEIIYAKCRSILESFLARWPIERVSNITLRQYVSVNDSDTFCQWVETRTKDIRSIKVSDQR